jgi:protein required for attachment to host cells
MKRLSRHGRVAVIDGARALMFRNTATPPALDLRLERSRAQENPPTHEQGTDVPGRTNDAMGRRSAMETTDFHQMAEDRFIAGVADELSADLARGEFSDIVIAAPPSALAVLRRKIKPALRSAIVLEIDKDLTRHAPAEVARIVAKSLEEASEPR